MSTLQALLVAVSLPPSPHQRQASSLVSQLPLKRTSEFCRSCHGSGSSNAVMVCMVSLANGGLLKREFASDLRIGQTKRVVDDNAGLLCRLTKFAVSSLGFEDIPAAVKYLSDALKLLTQPS